MPDKPSSREGGQWGFPKIEEANAFYDDPFNVDCYPTLTMIKSRGEYYVETGDSPFIRAWESIVRQRVDGKETKRQKH